MASTIVVCIDGSDLSLSCTAAGLDVIARYGQLVIVNVIGGPDPSALIGAGHVGPAMSVEKFDQQRAEAVAEANASLADAALALDLRDADRQLLEGDPGPSICDFASKVSATAIVIGSRGRGGLKRAMLGSVSDYVVRNAPCTVVVTSPPAL